MKGCKSETPVCLLRTVLMGKMMFAAHEISAATVLTKNTTGIEDGDGYELGSVQVQYLAAKNERWQIL